MIYNVNKIFSRYNFETAEPWLNKMCSEGKALVSFGTFSHIFEDCRPGQYQYKLIFNDLSSIAPGNIGFEDFLTDCGIDIVQKYGDWYILRRENNGEDFIIYNTLDSEINYLENKKSSYFLLLISTTFLFVSNIYRLVSTLFTPPTELVVGIINVLVIMMWMTLIYKAYLYYINLNKRIKNLKKAREIHE